MNINGIPPNSQSSHGEPIDNSPAERVRAELLAAYPRHALESFVDKGEQHLRILIPVRGFFPVFAIDKGQFVPRVVSEDGPKYSPDQFRAFVAETWAQADAGLWDAFKRSASERGHFSVDDVAKTVSIPNGAGAPHTYTLKYGMLTRTSNTGTPAEMRWGDLRKVAVEQAWQHSGVDKAELDALVAGTPWAHFGHEDNTVEVQGPGRKNESFKVSGGKFVGEGKAMSFAELRDYVDAINVAHGLEAKRAAAELAAQYPKERVELIDDVLVIKPWEGEEQRFTIVGGFFVPANAAAGDKKLKLAELMGIVGQRLCQVFRDLFVTNRDLQVTYHRPEILQVVGDVPKWTHFDVKNPEGTTRVFTTKDGRISESLVGGVSKESSYAELKDAIEQLRRFRDERFAAEMMPFIAERPRNLQWDPKAKQLIYGGQRYGLSGKGLSVAGSPHQFYTFAEFQALVRRRETHGTSWVNVQARD